MSRKKTSTNFPISPTLLILGGIFILIAVVLLVKNQTLPEPKIVDEPPEVILDGYIAKGQPVFVFFHSNNCQSCLDMIRIVDQVYPKYQDQIALMDINVYDPENQNLIRRARINTIPSQVFINKNGQGNIIVGVMEPEQLRRQLGAISGIP